MPQKRSLLAISVVLFISFVIFSYFVAKDKFTQFDFNTTVRLQDHISRKFDFTFSIFSEIGSAEISGIFWVGIVFFCLLKKYFKTALALMLFPISLLFELFGKVFVHHPPPPHLLYRGVIQFDFPSSFVPVGYSYPSGHVTRTSFIIIFLIGFIILRKYKYPGLIFTVLLLFLVVMIISRVYLGEHWTTDVIGGLLIGSSFGLLAVLTIPLKNSAGLSKKEHQPS